MNDLKCYASQFARLGGISKTEKKAAAARKNGLKGGRPKKGKPQANKRKVSRKSSKD